MDYREALRRAADHYGIEPEYTDTWGRNHASSEEAIRLALSALGVPTGSAEEIDSFLDQQAAEQWTRPFDPALVVREDAPSLALRIPASRSGASVKLEIQWEGGALQHHWFWLPELQNLRQGAVDGRQYLEKRVPLPKPLRQGYHTVRIYWMKEPQLEVFGEARFIVCPARVHAADGRMAGVALSLYGLRSARNWGCGDVTDLRAAIEIFARAGAEFIALNPLHALANRQPYNTSPYLPQNSMYRNFIYIDVEKTPGYSKDEWLLPEIKALRASELVEYERVAHLKLTALTAAFERFLAAGGSPEFDAFVEAEGEPLRDDAVYSALHEEMHRRDPDLWIWTDWLPDYRNPRSQAVEDFAREHSRRVRFFMFLQWQLDVQLAEAQLHALACGMKIGLYHDLALATDRYGADLWANPDFYIGGCRVGAPPDDLAPSGQDWGFLPPNRDAHRRGGYNRFAQSIRKAARHGGALRIDHVMRLFRLYWIPGDLSAAEGVYVRDYASDLLGVLALESVRHRTPGCGSCMVGDLWLER